MPKIPRTAKIEEIAEDLELQSFQIDDRQLWALIKFGLDKETGFDTFDVKQFGIDYSNLDSLINQKLFNEEQAEHIAKYIKGKITRLRSDIMELILSLHEYSLVTLPEKVSRWKDPE